MTARFRFLAGALALLLPLSLHLFAEDAPPATAAPEAPIAEEPSIAEDDSIPLHGRQDAIAQRFKRFERLLLQMSEYMRKTDPEQADLLNRAIGKSKSDRISSQMDAIALLLKQDQLGDAIDREQQVIESLQTLLDLLQSGDRMLELKSEQARIRDLIKDVDRGIGLEKDARASNERNDEAERAIERQEIAEAYTKKLLEKISAQDAKRAGQKGAEDQNGESKDGESKDGESKDGESKDGESKDGESKPGEPKDGESKPGESKPGEAKPGEAKPGEAKPGEAKPGEAKPGEAKPGEAKPGEAKPGEAKPGEAKPGEAKPGEAKPGEAKPGEAKPGESSQSQQDQKDKTPGRDEIAQAVERMNRAIEELKKQARDGASKEQSKAIADLEAAKAKLEEILRQLREEERELLLAALEARFQKMLAMQLMVYTGTVNLDKTSRDQWTSRHQSRSRELAQVEDEIAREAVKALDLLKEEGSSIAFPEAIEQMRNDMLTVAGNLERSDVGELTQLIEKDIMEMLGEVIEALQKEMEKGKDKDKDKPPGEQGPPPDPALVDKLAELKMLRSLQMRINRRTKLLARDFRGEQADQEQVIQLLQDLARRQARIQQTAYDLATGRNQ